MHPLKGTHFDFLVAILARSWLCLPALPHYTHCLPLAPSVSGTYKESKKRSSPSWSVLCCDGFNAVAGQCVSTAITTARNWKATKLLPARSHMNASVKPERRACVAGSSNQSFREQASPLVNIIFALGMGHHGQWHGSLWALWGMGRYGHACS